MAHPPPRPTRSSLGGSGTSLGGEGLLPDSLGEAVASLLTGYCSARLTDRCPPLDAAASRLAALCRTFENRSSLPCKMEENKLRHEGEVHGNASACKALDKRDSYY